MPNESKYRIFGAAVLSLILLALGVGCFARAFNHDEAQFVASGALLAREGLLPYLHYPYFHLPNLVFVYATLFLTNDYLLLTARTFNVVCAWLLLLLLYRTTASAFEFLGAKRWVVASAVAFLLALNPLFRFTAGRAWNHDLPILASLAAVIVLLRAMQSDHSYKWLVASGLLLGVAAGTRLTYVPLVVPFLLLTLIYHPPKLEGWRGALLFLAAFSLALLPTIALFAAAPSRFLFDNFTYNRSINLRFRQHSGPGAITLGNRLLFPLRMMGTSPANLLLLAAFVVFGCWLPLREGWRNLVRQRASAVLLLVVPFALLGALIPSPPYRQYYYAFVPFLLLGVIVGIARVWREAGDARKIFGLLASLIIVSFCELLLNLRDPGALVHPDRWPVWTLHQKGLETRRLAGPGPILTLTPVHALEGGGRIYKEFCTGSFAWRTTPFMNENDKARYDMVDAQNLDSFLSVKPPALLTGFETQSQEKALIEYAQRNGYTKFHLSDHGLLWLRSP